MSVVGGGGGRGRRVGKSTYRLLCSAAPLHATRPALGIKGTVQLTLQFRVCTSSSSINFRAAQKNQLIVQIEVRDGQIPCVDLGDFCATQKCKSMCASEFCELNTLTVRNTGTWTDMSYKWTCRRMDRQIEILCSNMYTLFGLPRFLVPVTKHKAIVVYPLGMKRS